ncbi:MAG TPA: PKD domain-containing protein [Saprospiraceae bacterium]|nr:PKD domain-containing protein [Saprospiraceae bacterium]
MKSILLTSYILFQLIYISSGQVYDRFWITGYDYWHQSDSLFGGSYIDFSLDPPNIFYDPNHKMNFNSTEAIVCDSSGSLLFYSNGMTIHDAEHKIVPNGDTIGFGPNWMGNIINDQIAGLKLIQGSFIVPDPKNPSSKYFLVHTKADIKDVVLPEMSDILLTKIDIVDGKPIIISKDENILHDTLMYGKIAICRHANGRDWWVLVGRKNDNKYYTLLINEEGISIDTVQIVGEKVLKGVGQAGFAKEGSLYYRYEGYNFSDTGAVVHLYDFDRCTGLLSNHRHWILASYSLCGTVASPNGRYLYTTDALNIWQWDLDATDIKGSGIIVSIFDGYVEPDWFPTYFSFMNLGPDGRIYIIPPTGGSMIMHTIERPNERGEACKVIQHKIKLPTWNARTIPFIPDFRLGPIDGSSCDTLGIDNHPVAKFRYEAEVPDLATLHFINLSYYSPTEWTWDFGDGDLGNDINESHTYDQTGTYTVCLTVSNSIDSNTSCKDVFVEVPTGTNYTPLSPDLNMYPNPFNDFIKLNDTFAGPVDISLFDIEGRKILNVNMTCPCTIVTDFLTPGVYFYEISMGQMRNTGKLIKI